MSCAYDIILFLRLYDDHNKAVYDIHDLWSLSHIIGLWWYHSQYHVKSASAVMSSMGMHLWYHISDALISIMMTYDIIGLWYHSQYHVKSAVIPFMISWSWIYDIIFLMLWYQWHITSQAYDIIGNIICNHLWLPKGIKEHKLALIPKFIMAGDSDLCLGYDWLQNVASRSYNTRID